MSDDGPKINVTRGKRADKEKKNKQAQSSSTAPGAMEVATGLAQRAREMWLAGLGALSLAEEAGTKVFDALVEEGKSWEEQRRKQQNCLLVAVAPCPKGNRRHTEFRVRLEIRAVDDSLVDDLLRKEHQECMQVNELGFLHTVVLVPKQSKPSAVIANYSLVRSVLLPESPGPIRTAGAGGRLHNPPSSPFRLSSRPHIQRNGTV